MNAFMVDDQSPTAQFPVRQAIPAPLFLCGDLFQALHQCGFVNASRSDLVTCHRTDLSGQAAGAPLGQTTLARLGNEAALLGSAHPFLRMPL
jgi:hypothetical protein